MKHTSLFHCGIAIVVFLLTSLAKPADMAVSATAFVQTKSATKTTSPFFPIEPIQTTSTTETEVEQTPSQIGQGSANPPPSELDQVDTILFEKLSRLYTVFRTDADKIWDNSFRLDQDIVYLVREDAENALYGYVINHPNPEEIEGASRLRLSDDLGLPPVHRVDKLDKAQLALNPFEFEYPLAGESVLMMKYTTPDVDSFVSPTSGDWDLFLAHEAFHRHQFRNWHENDNIQDLSNYNFSADALALMLLEQHILQAGLNASDGAARTQALRLFSAVRNYRIETYGGQIVTLDNEQERLEGAALYIEHQIRALSNRPSMNLTEELLPSFDDYVEFDMRDYFGFNRFYATGSAIGRILDLQGIDWKNGVANGDTQYDVIINHYDIRDRDALLEAAKAAYNYSELLTQAERYSEEASAELKRRRIRECQKGTEGLPTLKSSQMP